MFAILLTILEYTIFMGFVILAAYQTYKLLNNEADRHKHRIKLQKEFKDRQEKIIERANKSKLQEQFKDNSIRLSALQYHIIRFALIFVVFINYMVVPLISTQTLEFKTLGLMVFIYIITEPNFKYSIITIGLKKLRESRQKKLHTELFTLFDMLKAELRSLNDGQEVNVYNLLKESVGYFDYINVAIMKFLRLWKSNPQTAREVFHKEIGGDHADILADILYKLDSTSKQDALKIMENEAQVFSFSYYENEFRKGENKNIFVFTIFILGNVLILIWAVVVVIAMFSGLIGGIGGVKL